MADDEPVTIVTMRVASSGPVPKQLGESTQMPCDGCGEACWITSTTFPKMLEYPNHRVMCNVCIAPRLMKEDIENLDIRVSDPRFNKMLETNREGFIKWMIRRSLD